jgi:hypothetical protein
MDLGRVYFLALAIICIAIAIFSNALYDWGTVCARRWGWTRIVGIRERMKYWALPFSRALMILLAVGCLVAAVLL